MAVKNTTIFVNTIIYQLHVSAYFRHLATMPQEPTPRANRPTNELTKRTHTCANTVSTTNPIFVNEISSLPLHICI